MPADVSWVAHRGRTEARFSGRVRGTGQDGLRAVEQCEKKPAWFSDTPGPTGSHLDRLVPMVLEFCHLDDDELRESCLQALEAFLRK